MFLLSGAHTVHECCPYPKEGFIGQSEQTNKSRRTNIQAPHVTQQKTLYGTTSTNPTICIVHHDTDRGSKSFFSSSAGSIDIHVLRE